MHAWVVTGGEPQSPEGLRELPPPRLVVAADSGADIAGSLGLTPDVIVGDFDSVTPAGAAAATDQRRFPTDKDATDLALALAEARHRGATDITVVGGAGGRLDHFLANVAALASDDLAGAAVGAVMGTARLWVVRPQRTRTIGGPPGGAGHAPGLGRPCGRGTYRGPTLGTGGRDAGGGFHPRRQQRLRRLRGHGNPRNGRVAGDPSLTS